MLPKWGSSPCLSPASLFPVKNTFLHVDDRSVSPCDRRRSGSTPPSLRPRHQGDLTQSMSLFDLRCAAEEYCAPVAATTPSTATDDDCQTNASSGGFCDQMGIENYHFFPMEAHNHVWMAWGDQETFDGHSPAVVETSSVGSTCSTMNSLPGRLSSKDHAYQYGSHCWGGQPGVRAMDSCAPMWSCENLQQLKDSSTAPGSKETPFQSRADPMSWDDNVLTVMMRKVPQYYTQRMLLERVVERGFGEYIDFLYLPFDHGKRKNVGYGFVNFTEPKHALAFRDAFDDTYLDDGTRCRFKQVRVHPASLQGFNANWQHFKQTKTGQKQDPEYSPLFFPSPNMPVTDPDLQACIARMPTLPIASKNSIETSEQAMRTAAQSQGAWSPKSTKDNDRWLTEEEQRDLDDGEDLVNLNRDELWRAGGDARRYGYRSQRPADQRSKYAGASGAGKRYQAKPRQARSQRP